MRGHSLALVNQRERAHFGALFNDRMRFERRAHANSRSSANSNVPREQVPIFK